MKAADKEDNTKGKWSFQPFLVILATQYFLENFSIFGNI
jgi:hypothetical protein